MSVDARPKTDWVSTPCSVGVYKPVGVDNAMEMSAWGRTVRVGFASGAVFGMMVERKIGHSSIARERVFRRMGRKVSLVNC